MSTYAEIKKLANQLKSLSSISESHSKVKNIIAYVRADEITEKEWLDAEDAGQVTNSDVVAVLAESLKKQNRVKHTFTTLAAINSFVRDNDCGSSWIDGDNYSVYSY